MTILIIRWGALFSKALKQKLGHDEYLYMVTKDFLPPEALYVIRFHSFYAAHREGSYAYLMSDEDEHFMQFVKAFNAFDLYSKNRPHVDVGQVKEYYQKLIQEFFPDKIKW